MNKLLFSAAAVVLVLLPFAAVSPISGQEKGVFRNPAFDDDPAEVALADGRALLMKGQVSEAIKQFEKAATMRDGDCVDCYRLIAQAHFGQQKYKEAAAAYQKAISLKPENEAELNNALGVSLYMTGENKYFNEAAEALERAIHLSEGRLLKAYYNLGHVLLKIGREEEGIAALSAYVESAPNSPEASIARSLIDRPGLVNEKIAPAFNVRTLNGEDISLDQLKGKIVLLDFWATWCGPCRSEMPSLKRLWKKFGGDEFVIVGVSLDRNEGSLLSYVKKEEITWPQYFDSSGRVATLYGVRFLPQTYLIDGDGVIRAVGLRGGGLHSKVETMLKKSRRERERE